MPSISCVQVAELEINKILQTINFVYIISIAYFILWWTKHWVKILCVLTCFCMISLWCCIRFNQIYQIGKYVRYERRHQKVYITEIQSTEPPRDNLMKEREINVASSYYLFVEHAGYETTVCQKICSVKWQCGERSCGLELRGAQMRRNNWAG